MKQPPARHRRERSSPEPRESSKDKPTRDEQLDEALEETFPASDPPAITQPHDTSPGSRDDPAKARPGVRKSAKKR